MITIIDNMNLRGRNTMGMDVNCRAWVEFTQAEDAPAAMAAAGNGKTLVLGGGSNILFCGDFDGTIVHPAILVWEAGMAGNGNVEITVGAGMNFDNVVQRVCEAGFWGLENLSGIPGSIGGAAVQNAGAYGAEIGDAVTEVYAWDNNERKFVTLARKDLEYGYRHSLFKRPENAGRYVALTVKMTVSSKPEPRLAYGPLKALQGVEGLTPMDVREEVLKIRDAKLPDVDKTGSAGSFFKNPVVEASGWTAFLDRAAAQGFDEASIPHYALEGGKVKIPAAWLIEQSGWKGKKFGGAAVWHTQPLIIVNGSGAAAPAEIVAIEKAIVQDVESRFGIVLEPEVVHV